ncbi:type I-E CRISPR-associated protein Cas7/Cse4/CasC, partial [Nitrolancea hollandica]|uniref:type I-E CRISPR-associated protein Cas7/Cse4/CasC n=1 Tax=Nitrolancea hollandica TaxID=1206749 RepID=UPI000688DB90
MFVELHLLQNFAPSNLNRDDTNAPKDCEFGGYRRARISSQCIKRAIRDEFKRQQLLPPERQASRTRRLATELVDRLQAAGKAEAEAIQVVAAAVQGLGLSFKDDPDEPFTTEYLLFLAESEITALTSVCLDYWEELAAAGAQVAPAEDEPRSRRTAKRAGKAALSNGAKNALKGVLDGGKAVDLALFGRMIADLPEKRIDAASQVGHAISTNRAAMEFDFYTAVDDLNPDDTSGAGMMGTVEFNSSCFYRYSNIDLSQLRRNLGEDDELVQAALGAFLRASVLAIPTGKQNSMAAQNPPSFVLAVVREDGLWSLANAFLQPVAPDRFHDLIEKSVERLDRYWGQLQTMYGDDGIAGAWCISLTGHGLTNLKEADAGNFNRLIQCVVDGAMA